MARILFVCHRIPYPPNKGDKIRAWHMLRHLCAKHDVHLLSWVDDPDDWRYADTLRRHCKTVCLRPLRSWHKLTRAASSFLVGRSITEQFYSDDAAKQFVRDLGNDLDAVVGFSGGVAPYLQIAQTSTKIIDLVDVDSEKWRTLAQESGILKSRVFDREARLVRRLEQSALMTSKATLLVSLDEADLFRRQSPKEFGDRIHDMTNGVDTAYFDPNAPELLNTPLPEGFASSDLDDIVFVGAMDYEPNIEAARYFVRDVLPLILQTRRVRFWIVGSKPTAAVQALAGDHVIVTGRVDDVRPYLLGADAVTAPLKLARGVQNKVLEAMAMARPVVATKAAATGIAETSGEVLDIANDPQSIAASLCALLIDKSQATQMGQTARAYVERTRSWPAQLDVLDRLIA